MVDKANLYVYTRSSAISYCFAPSLLTYAWADSNHPMSIHSGNALLHRVQSRPRIFPVLWSWSLFNLRLPVLPRPQIPHFSPHRVTHSSYVISPRTAMCAGFRVAGRFFPHLEQICLRRGFTCPHLIPLDCRWHVHTRSVIHITYLLLPLGKAHRPSG